MTMIKISLLFIWLGTVLGQQTHEGAAATPCEPSPYRRYDGRCNNVRHPLWGSAYTPYIQLTSGKRSSADLPNGALILQELDPLLRTGHHNHVTALLGLWSKLITNDISSPLPSETGGLLNAATAFLDGSGVYNDVERLKTPGGYVDTAKCELCRSDVGLGSLFNLLYKEHNRVVNYLRKANSDWSSDVLFEEAKKIVSAQVQHITYSEFLPIVLREVEWDPSSKRGFYNGYSSANQAGTIYESATTSLMLLSTMTPVPLALMHNVNFTDNYMESVISSSLSTPAQLPNARLVFNVLDHLRTFNAGRYNDILELCTGESAQTFSDMTFIPSHAREILSRIYRTVDDVDLLVGAVLEDNPQDTILGPILSCLLAQQFILTRDSDRFWYENDFPPASFTKDQLTEIRKVTLSGLICENTRGLLSIQPRAFVQEDPYLNALVSCDLHNALDLSQWKVPEPKRVKEPLITMEMVKAALKKAEEDLARRQRQEAAVYRDLGGVDPKSPIGTAAAFNKPNKMALIMANNSLLFEYASQELVSSIMAKQRRRRQLDGENVIGFDLPIKDLFSDVDLTEHFTGVKHSEDQCHDETGPCDPRSPYRTFTGHCNNVERPHLGKSMTTFARLLPSVYENGVSSPRVTSVTGTPLPSARLVSSMIHADISYLHTRYTLMVMQFAQFVDHDITFTPNHRGFFSSIPDCRPCNSPVTVHPECMPIPVPTNDHYYPPRNLTSGERICLPFMRSLPGQQALGSREQINQNSAYLDGSQIYGEHACLARQLRGFGGRLNSTILPSGRGKDLLPVSPTHPECKAPSGYCFIAGDGRASEQPGLTTIHTVFMREHNRIVDGLRSVNPHWGDEKLYQQTRRIVVAEYQHVLYNEFLPRILGWNAINLYGLKLNSNGYYNGYSSSCNPNVVTEFAAAAFRIGHSLLRPHIPRMSASFNNVEPSILLRDHFFNPDVIYTPHIIDEIMRGLTSVPMESLDQFITGEITNHLFEDRRIPHSGMDLPALNVQRARDHGIPPYNEYRSLCNLKRANTWDDLSRELPAEVIARLRLIYPTVNDIDLFPGGLSERPLQGGLVGPTFACIIGLQFRQLKKCDRFWYESGDPIVKFTEPQLAEIKKATLSKIVCDNMDAPAEIQRSAFDQPSDFLNPRVSCHSLPRIDLNAWRETAQQGCKIAGRTVAVGESAIPTPCTSCICTPEGAQCASLRVTDCGRLLREMGRDAVIRDDVCSAQCSLFLSDSSSSPVSTAGGAAAVISLTTRRPRLRSRDFLPSGLVPPPPNAKSRRLSLRSFVPDLGFLG